MSQQPRHRQTASRSVRLARSLTLVVLLAVSTYSLSGFSSATFTSRSATDIGTITAAADWTPPTVSIQSPGASATGTVTLNATASDGESGINNVVIQYQPAEGASWTTVCTDNTTPYSCSWNTTAVADGAYDLRAVATDNANYSTTSTTVRTTVANKLTVVLTDPGDVVKGNVILTSNVYNGGLIRYPNRVEYAVAGTTNWKTACTYALLSTDGHRRRLGRRAGRRRVRIVGQLGIQDAVHHYRCTVQLPLCHHRLGQRHLFVPRDRHRRRRFNHHLDGHHGPHR